MAQLAAAAPRNGLPRQPSRSDEEIKMRCCPRFVCLVLVVMVGAARAASAAEWFVAAGADGAGTSNSPFGHIQDALNVAAAGDTITVLPGTYAESLRTMRGGTADKPI